MKLSTLTGTAIGFGASTLIAGCGGGSNAVPGQVQDGLARTALSAPPCAKQKSTKDYAQSTAQKLSTKGGIACAPKFQDWGGSVKYPSYSGSDVAMTVISSTTAYNPGGFPPYTSAIFYLQLKFNKSFKFGSTLTSGATLAGPGLKVHSVYTIEGAKDVGSLWQVLPYCYTSASSGKYGAMIGGLGFPLKGGDFSTYEDAVVMVYTGKQQTNTKC
ncbi:MAG TPA: hypothetical protein VGX91_02295 [Candidatus Cybelea sp.]|jgi:hypothetical protein|nr:hypothetical protein [Candidatus Cybelea sp.]